MSHATAGARMDLCERRTGEWQPGKPVGMCSTRLDRVQDIQLLTRANVSRMQLKTQHYHARIIV